MSKIIMKNVASFGENPVILETSTKSNLIYGLNGSGKTTLADFLYDNGANSKFKDCKWESMSNEKILVYNQRFIQDNFYGKEKLDSIFTLSKENKEAEEAIEEAEKERQNKANEKKKIETTKTNTEKQKGDKLDQIRDAVWKIKTTYAGGDRVLEFCLLRLQRKDLLLKKITEIEKPTTEPNTTIEELKKETELLVGENATKYEKLQPVNLDVEGIEQDAVFFESIAGNEDSVVSDLIKKLSNSDWVRQGLDYLPEKIGENTEQCPFCQKHTITVQIERNIRNYFNEAYEQKIDTIKTFKDRYEQELLPAENDYTKHPFVLKHEDKFKNFYNQLQRYLSKNCSEINLKLSVPSRTVKLVSTRGQRNKLNALISEVNREIDSHNEKIESKEKTKTEIENKFWSIMRWQYDDQLNKYNRENAKLCDSIKKTNTEIEDIDYQIERQEQAIVNQQKKMVNIEEAIRNINNGLKELGIEGFSIKKHDDNSYKIVRGEEGDQQFRTLSEGEKMIISFLYFKELCQGKNSEDELEKDKVVVIDDPVSSLSHVYVFNVCQWIKKYFLDGNYKQVFVLTHNLYFFHELIKIHKKSETELFRVTKSSDMGTQIQRMGEDEIKNEYEEYWQVIKDHAVGKASDALLANVMRNILEHFFGFIYKSKLSDALDNLSTNAEFEPFLRYMNRESHSDTVNITDYKEIDHKIFKSAFRSVFDKSGYEKHYRTMMDENNVT